MRKGRRFVLCALPAASVWLAGCEESAPAAPPPPEVTVARPIQKAVAPHFDFTGSLKAIEFVEIRARVKGYLQEIKFEDSADVRKGDELFLIDPAPYRTALDAAEAELSSARAALEQAKWDYERVLELQERGAANPKEVQDRTTARDLAQAAVSAAQAQVQLATLDLSYTDIRSPIDGRVSRRFVDVGNLVGAGEATLLTTVVRTDKVYAYFNVPERLLLERLAERAVEGRRDPDVRFWVGLMSEEGYPHEGELDYIDNTVDPDTGTLSVRGVLSNDQGLLFPGAFVRVRFMGNVREDVVLVQERAIGTDLGGKYLLVVGGDNVVEHRPVVIGQLDEGVRVIEEGIGPNERYIVNGLQRARPGLPVTPQMEQSAETASP